MKIEGKQGCRRSGGEGVGREEEMIDGVLSAGLGLVVLGLARPLVRKEWALGVRYDITLAISGPNFWAPSGVTLQIFGRVMMGYVGFLPSCLGPWHTFVSKFRLGSWAGGRRRSGWPGAAGRARRGFIRVPMQSVYRACQLSEWLLK